MTVVAELIRMMETKQQRRGGSRGRVELGESLFSLAPEICGIQGLNLLLFQVAPHRHPHQSIVKMAVIQINAAVQTLPSDFPEKGFKATGKLSAHTQRAISPVGPYHLGASKTL